MPKKPVTAKEYDEFRAQLYCTIADMYRIFPVTRRQASAFIREIADEMEAEGLPPIRTRPLMVPTARVIAKWFPKQEMTKIVPETPNYHETARSIPAGRPRF